MSELATNTRGASLLRMLVRRGRGRFVSVAAAPLYFFLCGLHLGEVDGPPALLARVLCVVLGHVHVRRRLQHPHVQSPPAVALRVGRRQS
eukprot:4541679-Pyramimonas_sp.AAC.1